MATWTLPLASASLPLVPYTTTPFQAGMAWNVNQGGLWLAGYQWSVPAGGDTGSQNFRLWQLCDTAHSLVSAEVIAGRASSGPLTAGLVNTVMLASPVPLGQGLSYVCDTYWTPSVGFPDLQAQFGAGDPFAAGVSSGPLMAYSSRSGSAPVPFTSNLPQGLFGTSATVPPPMPSTGSNDSNFGISVIITDEAPADASYVLWPSQPAPVNWALDTADTFTLGTQFGVSTLFDLLAIQFYSPATAPTLPTEAGLWDIATEQLIAGTHLISPAWDGLAGSGWVEAAYPVPPRLPAYQLYKGAAFNADGGAGPWNAEITGYWSTGAGASGLQNGPLSAPGLATAASPGQGTYHLSGAFAYPDTFNGPNGANYLIGARIRPVAAAPARGSWAFDAVSDFVILGRP